jgi:hypothetical protein
MSAEVKVEIIKAWNRYVVKRTQSYKKNEGSTTQHEEAVQTFREGIVNHPKLSRMEKEELLSQIRIGGAQFS